MSAHETEITVRSYELDGFGHVNHAVFLNYFEFARFQTLEAAGFPPKALIAEGMGIHVARVEVDYKREARLGQTLTIHTEPEQIRNSSMTLAQEARSGEHLLARARVVVVWVGRDGRPTRIPDDVRAAL
ncbi:MAG: acyl-CoA thioesterase [Gemmatimonadetes bacterium]|nr:acyl-CoA thioesterase [Gemmatimonadota bacterium]MBT8403246.1 acyl-CoA thioesterase [Gemmatimonadota bacterium]NNK62192.1 acyl-CoA thioesterase [Gemmatimonadota bacterium]